MWEPRRLTTLRAFTACYRDSFTFFFAISIRCGAFKNSYFFPDMELLTSGNFPWMCSASLLRSHITYVMITGGGIPSKQLFSACTRQCFTVRETHLRSLLLVYTQWNFDIVWESSPTDIRQIVLTTMLFSCSLMALSSQMINNETCKHPSGPRFRPR
jgi:hypothetical protein